MQLVDQGKLDLHTHINEYVTDFKVPAAFEQPITLHHLLTHTGGFDEDYNGFSVRDYKDFEGLEMYLKEQMPQRIREPGIDIQYSNYGVSLAGYIVQQVSEMPYEEYVAKNIFAPLQMNHSRALLTEDSIDQLALEYAYKNGFYKPLTLYEFNVLPAGSVIALWRGSSSPKIKKRGKKLICCLKIRLNRSMILNFRMTLIFRGMRMRFMKSCMGDTGFWSIAEMRRRLIVI